MQRIRKIKVKINTTQKYLRLFNGIFDLTNKEISILSSFIEINMLKKDDNFCSVDNKKDVAAIMLIEDHNTLNNYIKRFKDKGVIMKKDNGYKLNPLLTPDADIVEIHIKRLADD